MMATAVLNIKAHDHPIESVTLFKSTGQPTSLNTASQKAEVTRTFAVDIQAGQTEIVITGLSGHIDTRSVRVSGLGEDASLFDVVCTVSKDSKPDESDGPERVRVLKAQKSILEGEKSVREREAELLMNYGKTLQGDHITPAQMTAFLDNFVERGRKNLEATVVLEQRIIDMGREIEEETKKAPSRVGTANGQVTVVLSSEAGGHIELTLTYVVSHATWEPTYDLLASTVNGAPASTVGLHYRARIWQSTGEDWRNTQLILSTATSDSVSQGVPNLAALHVKAVLFQGNDLFGRQAANVPSLFGGNAGPGPQQTTGTSAFGQSAPALIQSAFGFAQPQQGLFGTTRSIQTAPEPDKDDASEPELINVPEPGRISEPTTTVSVSPFSMSYKVDRNATVPSDGKAHQVLIASSSFEAHVTRIAVPRKKPVAYLKCRVKNTSDYRLLPGPVRVFLDDAYIATASIGDVNPSESFDCILGVDTSIHLSYKRSSSTANEARNAYSEQFKITTYTVETFIRNKHSFAVPELIVRDAVPHTRSGMGEKIRILLKEPAALAEAKPGVFTKLDDKGSQIRWVTKQGQEETEGTYEWTCKLQANGEIKMVTKYEVKAPVDFVLNERVL
ncbi:hypothetical protein GLOTRDRAFT_136449 [Gloeophyllum trabeum ATCC 11539]|uniref:DUF4139 domain-containing protein n=1 Tax=Gloeophyllum trabeum (strain ATCC 11539 / FP-39264 / Madison 617) TaxID=670483 RepID=S7RXH5_GLOTA|nr:uncharacterized protein GLOTRDRAFT_136449 [Gloeophyllum trabeum ATCC 11539]EPQ59620.1 hypothetical protein GLOTRDRAFT_136449 [Gloeophyllum trabeum ATCC 11539]